MPGVWGMTVLVLAFTGWIGGQQDANPQSAAAPAAVATALLQSSPAPVNSNGPSLKETTDWLASHLIGVIHTSRRTSLAFRAKKGKEPKEIDRQTFNTHESVSMVNFEGCAMTLGQLRKGDDYTAVTVSMIPLNSLTRASWKVVRHDAVKTQNGLDSSEVSVQPASEVAISLEASTNAITWKRKSSGNVPTEEDTLPFEGKGTSLLINSDDEAMPIRLVNAFNHAIQLCHTDVKPEPF